MRIEENIIKKKVNVCKYIETGFFIRNSSDLFLLFILLLCRSLMIKVKFYRIISCEYSFILKSGNNHKNI